MEFVRYCTAALLAIVTSFAAGPASHYRLAAAPARQAASATAPTRQEAAARSPAPRDGSQASTGPGFAGDAEFSLFLSGTLVGTELVHVARATDTWNISS